MWPVSPCTKVAVRAELKQTRHESSCASFFPPPAAPLMLLARLWVGG